MKFTKRTSLVAVIAAAAMVLAACGGSDNGSNGGSDGGPSGDPVVGGTARAIQPNEPRTLDPAAMGNSWSNNSFLGNALYGTLWINDPITNELEFKMAESFETEDGGKTFTLVLREGLVFSDGSPLTAEAVKFAWDRIKEPETSSPDIPQGALIESTEVVDDVTLSVTLVDPVPNFSQAVLTTSLNWIGKPEVIEGGQSVVDANPIGAGPYVLDRWARQDVLVLNRNDEYWDDSKAYLDTIELRFINDVPQRFNTLNAGGADVAVENSWLNVQRADDAGIQHLTAPLGGGSLLVMNSERPPFNDLRARQAIAHAIDLDAINIAVYEDSAHIATHLFYEDSPFYRDIPLSDHDPELAQQLFDDIAADGDPVSFSFSAYPGESRLVAEAFQAQLSGYDNVTMEVAAVDIAESGVITARGEFELIPSSAIFTDPEPRLWFAFHSESRGNHSKLNNPEMDAALDAGRVSEDEDERAEAYERVQELIVETVPGVFTVRVSPSVIANNNIGGLQLYGMGSLLPEELWIQP